MLKFDDGAYAEDCDDGEISVKNGHEASDAAVEDELSVESDDDASDADQPPQQPSSTDVQAPAKTPPTKFSKSQNRDSKRTWLTLTSDLHNTCL